MKKILFISATGNTNYTLAKELASYINREIYNVEIVNLENFNLPLFLPSSFKVDKEKHSKKIIELTNIMVSSDGFILCAPEYNGNIPPVVSNAIAWISTSTDYWKDAFKGKNFFIASSSGGDAQKFQISMENQIIHLGGIVFNKKIIINSKNKNNTSNSKKYINEFIKLL